MKKIVSLMMVIAMLFVSAAAFAEAAYTYGEYGYDESLIAEMTGEWVALEGAGLQFYLPDAYLPYEVSAEQAEQGCIASFTNEDSTTALTMFITDALDGAGNPIATVEDLAAYYASAGAANVDIILVNGIPAVTYMISEMDFLGYALLFDDATQLTISFAPASDANVAILAGVMMTTLMAA